MTGEVEDGNAAEALAKLRESLNAWDPKLLIEAGAPEDEYDPEAREIYHALTSGDVESEAALAICIAAIFAKWFGDPVTAEMCSGVAHTIWSRWRSG